MRLFKGRCEKLIKGGEVFMYARRKSWRGLFLPTRIPMSHYTVRKKRYLKYRIEVRLGVLRRVGKVDWVNLNEEVAR